MDHWDMEASLEGLEREREGSVLPRGKADQAPSPALLSLTHLLCLHLSLPHPCLCPRKAPLCPGYILSPHIARLLFVPFCPSVKTPTAAPPGQSLPAP